MCNGDVPYHPVLARKAHGGGGHLEVGKPADAPHLSPGDLGQIELFPKRCEGRLLTGSQGVANRPFGLGKVHLNSDEMT